MRIPRGTYLTAIAAAVIVLAFGSSVVLAEDGATLLKGQQFPSNEVFLVDGVPVLYSFTCDEQRVQRPDGSARDIAHCQLLPSETPPSKAALADPSFGYLSDFFVQGVPGFAGPTVTFDWHGAVTPSGRVTMVADFPAQ